MELALYWTRFAENKLRNIFNYYKQEVDISLAKKLVNGIVDKTIDLEKHPFKGSKEPALENRPQEFRYLIYKSYKIIYWVNFSLTRIEIVHVFDSRQSPEKLKSQV